MSRLTTVLHALHDNQISIVDLIKTILKRPEPQFKNIHQQMTKDTQKICTNLYNDPLSRKDMLNWATSTVCMAAQDELHALARKQHGLHFSVTMATSEQLEGTFMQSIADKMRSVAPTSWLLVISLLKPKEMRHAENNRGSTDLMDVDAVVFGDMEGDLGDIEERMDGSEVDGSDDEENEPNQKKQKKLQRRAAEQRVFLLNIRAVVCMSILLQNMNAQCNYLQGILGIFFHSTCMPQKVVDVLNHAGLSISQTSINHAVKSMLREITSWIRSAVGSLKASFAYDNFDINFKMHQPTVEHQSIFISATSATSIPLFGIEDPNDLQFSAEL
ncbi:hypothetical protein BDR06DRAFT_899551, partial [Suillus hirtellus]